MEGEEGVIVLQRAEIDTRAPFRSVKEAVTLFGEKVLAEELYANKLKEMHVRGIEYGQGTSRLGTVTAELKETKQSLEKAKEQRTLMANCLSSLQEELERTRKELQQLKEREVERQLVESEIEVVKVVEDTTEFEVKMQTSNEEGTQFQNKRYVTFANPSSLTQVLMPQGVEALERHPSLRKKKKKPLIPLIGGIFSKKFGK
ncbi:WEB family protein [Populus alba x Populus x berolinensis]|nr:WEB family protein [Populus alba x Populus x berolinensis]